MRRFVITVSVVVVTLLAFGYADSVARPTANVTIHVSSTQAGKPVEFAVRYFGAEWESGASRDHLATPFDITVPGDEAYALFRQTGGSGVMRLDVRNGVASSGSASGPIGMIIVTSKRLSITGFQQ